MRALPLLASLMLLLLAPVAEAGTVPYARWTVGDLKAVSALEFLDALCSDPQAAPSTVSSSALRLPSR